MSNQVFLIFVTETKSGYETDDFYLKRFANWACKELLQRHELTMHYVHMDGIGNYDKPSVLAGIRGHERCNPFGPCYVVYVVDRDRAKDQDRLEKIQTFVSERGFLLVVNNKNIEDAFDQKIVSNKLLTAERYKQQPDRVYEQKRFHTELNQVIKSKDSCTNLGVVLKSILGDAAHWKPKKKR